MRSDARVDQLILSGQVVPLDALPFQIAVAPKIIGPAGFFEDLLQRWQDVVAVGADLVEAVQ